MSGYSLRDLLIEICHNEPAPEHRVNSVCASAGVSREDLMETLMDLVRDGVMEIEFAPGAESIRMKVIPRHVETNTHADMLILPRPKESQ